MADARELWVWMNGERVGAWQRSRTGSHRFVYEESWLVSARVRPLSLSLPITPDRTVAGPVVANFFDNLLPDDERIRRRVSARFKVGSTDVFELLQAIGRDCVGAVQLLPPEQPPIGFDRVECEALDDQAVARHLRGVAAEPGLGADQPPDDLRISIAGAQEKTALLRVDGQWCRPLGATPTTHILKLPLGLVGGRRLDLTHSVYNEWLCAQLLRELGLPVATTDIATFDDETVLAVERFDRQWVDGTDTSPRWIARIPQEDFCQVLGRASHEKYEAQRGPGMAQCLQVLRSSRTAPADIRHFLCAQLAFWLLAATDGHAKNFSIFLLPGGGYRMTPLYDVISVWPVIGHGPNLVAWQEAKLAMAVRSRNAHYELARIQTRHWQGLAQRSGADAVWEAMQAMVARVEPAIAAVQNLLPAGFPERTAMAIFDGLRRQQGRWQAGLQGLAGPGEGG
ncbi:type II toxin-antitoxin system HipA family toxin [Piscinibacter sakaiensis]|uniref:HipA protein n=1 Tax=Piscinibacter sakaiensis TaxID=1547922 RepID=A0A0K8NYG5_PISS1|nr:type II toxin-antitoxin system HipA family toxin [Piscinibacter sakaiensis]GAP35413.1 HipA protein [Piscinibacter sakaiensis]